MLSRLDRNHLSKNITKRFDSALLKQCMVQLIDVTNFNILFNVVYCVVTLIKCEFKSSLTKLSEEYLQNFARGQKSKSLVKNVGVSQEWYQHLLNVVEKDIAKCSSSKDINEYFRDEKSLDDWILYFMGRFVLWSSIIPFILGHNSSSTSASLESYHNVLKNVFLDGKTYSIDAGIKKIENYVDEKLSFRPEFLKLEGNYLLIPMCVY